MMDILIKDQTHQCSSQDIQRVIKIIEILVMLPIELHRHIIYLTTHPPISTGHNQSSYAMVKWSAHGAWHVPDIVQISRKDLIV